MECLEFIRKYNLESSTVFSPWNSGNRTGYFEQEVRWKWGKFIHEE